MENNKGFNRNVGAELKTEPQTQARAEKKVFTDEEWDRVLAKKVTDLTFEEIEALKSWKIEEEAKEAAEKLEKERLEQEKREEEKRIFYSNREAQIKELLTSFNNTAATDSELKKLESFIKFARSRT